jgi:hypothetical protein
MTLSEVMRAAIKRDGRSLCKLALAAGLGSGVVVRFFNGTRGLGLDSADKLCKTLGLELRPVARRRQPARKGA